MKTPVNKNFSNFKEKHGEYLQFTYSSFLTNDKKYDKDKIETYKDIYNKIIAYYFFLTPSIPLILIILNPNFKEFVNNLLNKFLFLFPQDPYKEFMVFVIYAILLLYLPYFVVSLMKKNYYKKTNFRASKDGISLKTTNNEILFRKENILEFYIDKEINRQQDEIPPIFVFRTSDRAILIDFQETKQEAFCIVIVLKNLVYLPIYGGPRKELVLFRNLSEEEAEYLIDSINTLNILDKYQNFYLT